MGTLLSKVTNSDELEYTGYILRLVVVSPVGLDIEKMFNQQLHPQKLNIQDTYYGSSSFGTRINESEGLKIQLQLQTFNIRDEHHNEPLVKICPTRGTTTLVMFDVTSESSVSFAKSFLRQAFKQTDIVRLVGVIPIIPCLLEKKKEKENDSKDEQRHIRCIDATEASTLAHEYDSEYTEIDQTIDKNGHKLRKLISLLRDNFISSYVGRRSSHTPK